MAEEISKDFEDKEQYFKIANFINYLLTINKKTCDADGRTPEKEQFCRERGIEYVVLQRTPAEGLKARSSTDLKAETCRIPTRLDLAGRGSTNRT